MKSVGFRMLRASSGTSDHPRQPNEHRFEQVRMLVRTFVILLVRASHDRSIVVHGRLEAALDPYIFDNIVLLSIKNYQRSVTTLQ